MSEGLPHLFARTRCKALMMSTICGVTCKKILSACRRPVPACRRVHAMYDTSQTGERSDESASILSSTRRMSWASYRPLNLDFVRFAKAFILSKAITRIWCLRKCYLHRSLILTSTQLGPLSHCLHCVHRVHRAWLGFATSVEGR